MKLRYYLRGLGIGMVVTALLMGYSNHTHATTDTTARESESVDASSADELSAEGILADRNGVVASQEETEGAAAAETAADVETVTETAQAEEESSEEASSTEISFTEISSTEISSVETPQEVADVLSSAEATNGADASEVISHGEAVTLSIVRGDDSGTVARKLQTAGLVSDATEFDAYLMQHGYDKKIRVGTVEIPLGSTWVEIAELISGN